MDNILKSDMVSLTLLEFFFLMDEFYAEIIQIPNSLVLNIENISHYSNLNHLMNNDYCRAQVLTERYFILFCCVLTLIVIMEIIVCMGRKTLNFFMYYNR